MANSERCLKPFKCVTIVHDRAGALVIGVRVEGFNYITQPVSGDMNTEVNKRTQCGWNNWIKMSGVLCGKSVPTHVKGKIHTTIVQPAMLYGMETVPMTSYHVKQLEVT